MAKLNDAADGIKRFGDAFSGDKISNLIGPLVDFVKQNSGNIGGAISNIDNITGQIASGQGTVGKLIYDQIVLRFRNGHRHQFAGHRRRCGWSSAASPMARAPSANW